LQKLIENQQVLTLQTNQKLEITLKDDDQEINLDSKNYKRKWTDIFKVRK